MTPKPIRIQRKRTKGWRMPENTVYVGRGSQWGNPFIIGHWYDPQTLEVAPYRKYPLWKEITDHRTACGLYALDMMPYTHKHGTIEKFYISEANLNEIISQLRGKNLACWCAPHLPCHADLLLEWANG